jgi:hemolysin activation/secretion protein
MNVSNKIRLLGVLGTSVYFSLPASAQVAPEAGQALRDAQSEQLTLPQRQQLPLDIRAEDTIDQTSSASNISLQVNRVDIEGNQVISTDDLQSVLAGLTGQITLAQLQVGAAKVRQYYRDQGYPLVLSYIPAQEITDGVVKLMVVEGRYGDIKIHNNSGLHASVAQPLDLLRQGEIVTSSSLEKSLLLINEQPGVSARSVLRAGSVNGTSDLDVTISKTKSVSGAVYADNYGNKYTGQYRVGGTLNVLSPLNRGDQLNLNILGTNEAQYFGGVSYQIPVNRWGTQIGAGYSYLYQSVFNATSYLAT